MLQWNPEHLTVCTKSRDQCPRNSAHLKCYFKKFFEFLVINIIDAFLDVHHLA